MRERKPGSAIFYKAPTELKVNPEESFVVEDSVSGVQAANATGIMCLGIAAPPQRQALLDADADRVWADFADIPIDQLRKMFR